MNAPALSLVSSEGAGEVVGAVQPLIPPGAYRFSLKRWTTSLLFNKAPKVTYWLAVADFGPHFGVILPRYYNVLKLKGRRGDGGGFTAGRQSDLVREYAILTELPTRLDRINPDRLETLLIVGLVETVTTDRSQRRLPDCLHYSVVRRLLSSEAGHVTEGPLVSPAPRPTPAPTCDPHKRQLPQGFGRYRRG